MFHRPNSSKRDNGHCKPWWSELWDTRRWGLPMDWYVYDINAITVHPKVY